VFYLVFFFLASREISLIDLQNFFPSSSLVGKMALSKLKVCSGKSSYFLAIMRKFLPSHSMSTRGSGCNGIFIPLASGNRE